MKKLIALLAIVSFLIIPSASYTVKAACDLSAIRSEYSARGLSGSGIEQEAIDRCLAEQRRLDQQARDQAAADAQTNVPNNSSFIIGGAADQLQRAQNSSTMQRLKSQYGTSAYYSCYPCAYTDTSFPSVEASCLVQTESCLEKQVIQKTCSSGYVYFNSRCVTIDQGCKEQYGQGSYYRGTTDQNGKYSCDCSAGYKWNGQGTSCIIAPVVPVKTNDQICQDSYGSNSNWNGTRNDSGGLICDCKVGFTWNSPRTGCVVVPPTPSPSPTSTPAFVNMPVPITTLSATSTPKPIPKLTSKPTLAPVSTPTPTLTPTPETKEFEEALVELEATKSAEPKADIKIEVPKTQEQPKQNNEGLFVKVSNFFKNISSRIWGWFK